MGLAARCVGPIGVSAPRGGFSVAADLVAETSHPIVLTTARYLCGPVVSLTWLEDRRGLRSSDDSPIRVDRHRSPDRHLLLGESTSGDMYVGRLLIVGPAVGAYRVSSRSFPNREVVEREGTLTVVPNSSRIRSR